MSNKIKIMSPDLASKIAAGEVVENQASVVKELIENAIDAKASKIDVVLINNGVQLIEVIDNGTGMSKEDLLLASQEHATSKLLSEYDLFNIHTLGFRGEALASIKSVSKLSISSNDGNQGYTYQTYDDTLIPGYSQKGTKVSVYNIFYNVPARFKYLQSFKKELSKVIDVLNKYALTYPNIAFSLVNDNQVLLKTNGNNDILQVIHSIYSIDIVKGLEKLEASNNDFVLSGYISNKETTRSNKNHINLFINNRLVLNKELVKAVIEGYEDYLMERRYPIVCLNIACDYQLVDVNVHPAKLEVRVSKEEELLELIRESIKEHFSLKRKSFFVKDKVSQPSLDFSYDIKQPLTKEVSYGVSDSINIEEDTPFIEDKPSIQDIQVLGKEVIEEIHVKVEIPIKEEILVQNSKIHLIAIGQYNQTYILASSDKGLHIIDQHAAAERINYEKLLEGSNDINQVELLVPIIIPLTSSEKLKVDEHVEVLNAVGLVYEQMANHDLCFRSIPKWIDIDRAFESVSQCIEYLLVQKNLKINEIKKEQMILASCKMSLKANYYMSKDAQQALLNQLVLCENYDHCPHGRPIIITLSNYDIEKLFKRVV